jgi:hypothetical protein
MPTPRRITDELLDPARDLIAAGVTIREAASALECVDSTLGRYGLRDDPELTRQRRAEHARSVNKRWTRDLIVAAINAWAELHGAPPAVSDWTPAIARRQGRADRAERHAAGDWPFYSTVVKYFGSWAAAIEAAGWRSRPRGSAPSKVTDELLECARALIAAGASMREAADALELSPSALRYYGLRGIPDRRRPRAPSTAEHDSGAVRRAEILAEHNARFPVDQQVVDVFGEQGDETRPGAYAMRRGHKLHEAA